MIPEIFEKWELNRVSIPQQIRQEQWAFCRGRKQVPVRRFNQTAIEL